VKLLRGPLPARRGPSRNAAGQSKEASACLGPAGFAGVDKKKLEILALIVWCRANPSNKDEIELTFR